MAIPRWEDLVRPVLECACEEPITHRSASARVFEVIPLTAVEKQARIKSGLNKIESRTGWAMSHLTKAGFIEKVARTTYRATDKGVPFGQSDDRTQNRRFQCQHHRAQTAGFRLLW